MRRIGHSWSLRDRVEHLLMPVVILSLQQVGPFTNYDYLYFEKWSVAG